MLHLYILFLISCFFARTHGGEFRSTASRCESCERKLPFARFTSCTLSGIEWKLMVGFALLTHETSIDPCAVLEILVNFHRFVLQVPFPLFFKHLFPCSTLVGICGASPLHHTDSTVQHPSIQFDEDHSLTARNDSGCPSDFSLFLDLISVAPLI